MKKLIKLVSPLCVAIVVGYLFGFIMFEQYNDALEVYSSDLEKVYFIQSGVYSTYESMISNTKLLENYIFLENDNMFYVFVSITKLEENKDKLVQFYKNQNIDVLVKEYNINNMLFLDKLNNYDQELLTVQDNNSIEDIIKKVLTEYKESSE